LRAPIVCLLSPLVSFGTSAPGRQMCRYGRSPLWRQIWRPGLPHGSPE